MSSKEQNEGCQTLFALAKRKGWNLEEFRCVLLTVTEHIEHELDTGYEEGKC